MFTGIVEDLGTLREVRRGSESARLRVATRLPLRPAARSSEMMVRMKSSNS